MSFLSRIFGEHKQRERLQPLYRAIVSAGRDPFWYREGRVPDTLDGRFDMLAAIFALVLLRLEKDAEARGDAALLTEIFIEDMDGTLRQIGIGDYVVGKHIGRLMGALGGRLGAFRSALAEGAGLEAPVRRNIFRDAPPDEEAPVLIASRLERFDAGLHETAIPDLLSGKLPRS